jgi:hypothetical protein
MSHLRINSTPLGDISKIALLGSNSEALDILKDQKGIKKFGTKRVNSLRYSCVNHYTMFPVGLMITTSNNIDIFARTNN